MLMHVDDIRTNGPPIQYLSFLSQLAIVTTNQLQLSTHHHPLGCPASGAHLVEATPIGH